MKTMDHWKKALKKVWDEGYYYVDSDNREARETQNLIIKITDVPKSFIDEPLNTLSKSNKWVYPSKEEITNVMFKEYQSPIYEYTYGGRLFNFSNQLNQINKYIIPLLKKDPESRRGIICVYDPLNDSFLSKDNVPSIVYISVRILNNKLFLTGMIRSTDLFFGWPANVYQLYSIQKYIAEKLNVSLGDLTTISNSAHIFEKNKEDVEDLLGDVF